MTNLESDIMGAVGSERPDAVFFSVPVQSANADRLSLRRVVSAFFYAKLAVLSVLLALTGLAVVNTHGLTRILMQICLGAVLAHATELIHQCLHRTATGRARRDQTLGMMIATPLGISFWRYLTDHFAHHKDVTKESFSYNYQRMDSPSRAVRLVGFLLHASMINHFLDTIRWMGYALTGRLEAQLKATRPGLNPAIVRRVTDDYLTMAGMLAAAIVVTVVFRTDLIIQVWLIPMIIGWAPIHALIELPEHWKCETWTNDARLNSRSIRATWLARWYVNNNCNHIGHHVDLSIAMDRLPDYEVRLMNEAPFKYFEESYPRFYLRFFRYLLTGAC